MYYSFLSVQCALYEVTFQTQKGYIIVIYQSPSQSTVELDELLSNFESLLNLFKGFKPYSTIILFGGFNARSKSW